MGLTVSNRQDQTQQAKLQRDKPKQPVLTLRVLAIKKAGKAHLKKHNSE
jgi:hypothetical protein